MHWYLSDGRILSVVVCSAPLLQLSALRSNEDSRILMAAVLVRRACLFLEFRNCEFSGQSGKCNELTHSCNTRCQVLVNSTRCSELLLVGIFDLVDVAWTPMDGNSF